MNNDTTTLIAPAIIGAGPVGRAIAEQLVAAGHTPTLITRSGTELPGTRAVAADMTDPSQARSALHGADVAFQCAQPEYHRWVEEFRAFQTGVIDACASTGTALIATENTYGYGQVKGPMTEDTPMRPNTRKGTVRADMWLDLADAHQTGRVRTAAVRASDFFGPHVEGSAYGDRFFDGIVSGKKVDVLGRPDARHSITYVPDLAVAMIRVAQTPDSWGRAWHAPTAPAVTQAEIISLAATSAGTDPSLRLVKAWQLNVMGLFVKPVKEMIELRYEFDNDYVVDSTAFETHFGVQPTPLDESLAATVGWFARASTARRAA